MTKRVLSFNFDGCLFNENYIYSGSRDVVEHNRPFLDQIKVQNKAYSGVTVFVGSNRQSKDSDDNNAVSTGSCYPAVQQVANHLAEGHKGVQLDTFLLADIYGELADGISYARAIDENYTKEHASWVDDKSKATILYAQIHRAALANPTEEIHFDFYESDKAILQSLQTFYNTHNHLIPKNVTLRLNHYEGTAVAAIATINGTGIIDANYRLTVQEMAIETVSAMQLSEEDVTNGAAIDTAQYLNPNKLSQPTEPYKMALTRLENLLENNKDEKYKEINKHVGQLIAHIETLKGKEPITDLTKALEDTYKRLTGNMDTKEYTKSAKMMQGKPSTGLQILGGIMLALGIALAVLGIVFFPALLGVAAAAGLAGTAAAAVTGTVVGVSSVGVAATGVGLFAKGFKQTGLSKDMKVLDEKMVAHPDVTYSVAATA